MQGFGDYDYDDYDDYDEEDYGDYEGNGVDEEADDENEEARVPRNRNLGDESRG